MDQVYLIPILENIFMACKSSVGLSPYDYKKHFDEALCQACRHLTVHQLTRIKSPGAGIIDGLSWYSHHLFHDHYANRSKVEQEQAEKELNRIGFAIELTPDQINLITWKMMEDKAYNNEPDTTDELHE